MNAATPAPLHKRLPAVITPGSEIRWDEPSDEPCARCKRTAWTLGAFVPSAGPTEWLWVRLLYCPEVDACGWSCVQ